MGQPVNLIDHCMYMQVKVIQRAFITLLKYIMYIDPFHARHSIAVTAVMYHMSLTYERWRSSEKTERWIQAKCITVRKMTWHLSRRLPQVSIAAFTEDFRIVEWPWSLTSNSAE